MPFVDGAGTLRSPATRFTASAVVESVGATPVTPTHRTTTGQPDLLVLVHNSTASNSDVEIVVSTSSTFASTAWSTTLTNVADGHHSVVATGLLSGTTYYWRVRAADTGTTGWSAWSTTSSTIPAVPEPWQFRFLPGISQAHEYIFMNTGAVGVPVATADEHVYVNVGVEVTIEDGAHEYVYVNVGFLQTPDDGAHEYVYLGDVNEDPPTPHLWFLWLPFGFEGDEVWAYGHGFGNPQAELSGSMRVNPGPDYGTPDVTAGVNDWYEQPADADAYTEDRTIYPGTTGAPPVVNTEVGIIRFLIPSGISPSDFLPFTHLMYVLTSEGASNSVAWINYATIPVPNANVPRPLTTNVALRLSAEHDAGGIEQRYFFTETPQYVITGGRAERPPAFSSTATTVAELGTWSTEDALASQLAVDLEADWRWVADEALLTPRPDLGTGVVLWEPSVGPDTVGWMLRDGSSPYIEPAYTIPSRLGDLSIPAMIFPGDAFAELLDDLETGPTFTIAIVAVLHAPPEGRGTVFSTFQEVPNPSYYDWEIYHQSDRMKLAIGGISADRNLNTGSGRPVIIVGSVYGVTSRLLVVDEKPSSHYARRTAMSATGNRAYLGRSWRLTTGIDFAAMDVLDVAWWNTGKVAGGLWAIANRLDGIYGVTG